MWGVHNLEARSFGRENRQPVGLYYMQTETDEPLSMAVYNIGPDPGRSSSTKVAGDSD